MRHLLPFLLTAFAFGCAHIEGRQPATERNSMDCREATAREVREGKAVVPQFIYHFGKRAILDRNLLARTVPEADWRDFVFGEKTTWTLPRFRRGLYGTERALRADSFADVGDPALIRIEISKACRNPGRVATTLGLLEDPRFTKFLGVEGMAAFRAECVDSNRKPRIRSYGKFDRTPPAAEVDRCEGIVDSYFTAIGALVVQDEAVDASWYLRDRNCIRRIEGTDRELLGFFSQPDFFSGDRCGNADRSLSTFRIFARMVLKKRPAKEDVKFTTAVRNWVGAGLTVPSTSAWIDSFFDAYLRCSSSGHLDELAMKYAEFENNLPTPNEYAYWVRENGEEPNPDFDSACRGLK